MVMSAPTNTPSGDPRAIGNAHRARHFLELAKRFPSYDQPPRNPKIAQDLSDGRVTYKHAETGDRLVAVPGRSEAFVNEYYFEDAKGHAQVFYQLQTLPGYPAQIAFDPYRLFRKYHGQGADPETISKKYGPADLAEFLASEPVRLKWPERRFVLVDAPLQDGEQLR